MQLLKHSLFLALCLTLGLPSEAGAGEPATVNSYTIVFDAERPKTARVEATVSVRNQTLRMASWGHPYLPKGWATFVNRLEITDQQGVPVHFEDAGDDTWGAWTVDAQEGAQLELEYEIEFSQDQYDWDQAGGQDSRPALSNGALFLVTKALFIYSSNDAGAEIDIIVPDQWTISSPWPAVDGAGNRFAADTWISLVNNALVVGQHEQRIVNDGQMTVVLAVDEQLSDSVDLFEQTFRKQLGAYRALFDGTPNSVYLVSIRPADEDDGESFQNSFNQVITAGDLNRRMIVWANTMGHELFHYWNGNHFLVGAEKPKTEWFGEGFTEYYASLTLLRTGLIDEDLWFRKLETYLARYVITTRMWPVDTPSLVEAGQDKHKNWLRIYGGGATMALALDIEIRSATNGQRGLDDVMLLLKQRFSEPGSRYRVSDILDAVNTVSNEDFGDFFEAHIMGTESELDIASLLTKAGLNTEQFSDEFYLTRMAQPSPLQESVYSGITSPPGH